MTRTEELRRAVDAALGSPGAAGSDPEAVTASALDGPVHVAGVTLAVRDIDRVAAFYEDVVGLHALGGEAGKRRLGAGGRTLVTLEHAPDAVPDDPAQAGLYHTAFLLPARADLGRWLRQSAARRLPLDGAADHLVSEAVYLHDPEGNGIEIYADRPRTAWVWDDGRVAMGNQPLDFPGLLAAGGTDAWRAAPDGTVVGHVHLRVGDAAGAAEAYAQDLGVALTRSWPAASFLSWGGYHHHLAANTWSSRGAGPRPPAMAGLRGVTLAGTRATCTDPWGIAFG